MAQFFVHHRWGVLLDVLTNRCSSSSAALAVVGERHNKCCTQGFIYGVLRSDEDLGDPSYKSSACRSL